MPHRHPSLRGSECQKTFILLNFAANLLFRQTFVSLGSRHTHNASLGVPLATIAEGGRQRGGAALVVQGRASVVDGRVDGDGPHAGSVAVAVAVVVAAAVSRCPHVYAAFASAALKTPTAPSREKDTRLGRHVISSSNTNILFTLSIFFNTYFIFCPASLRAFVCLNWWTGKEKQQRAALISTTISAKTWHSRQNATDNRDICCFLHPASLYSGLL